MRRFKATLINEVEKLYKRKKVTVAVVLSVILIILVQVTMSGVKKRFGLRAEGSMEFPIFILSIVINSIIPLFTALITIDSFSGEFSQNTMKIAITRPITRFKFYTAKLVAIEIYIIGNLLFVMIFSIIAGLIFSVNSFSIHGLLMVILSYLITILPMTIVVLLIAFLTNIFRSGIAVFFLSIIIFIGFEVLAILYSQYSGILFTSMLDWYKLWIMSDIQFSKLFREFMLMLSYGILLFTGGYYLFDKKDF